VLLQRSVTVSLFLAICTIVLLWSHQLLGAVLFLVVVNLFVVLGLLEFYALAGKKDRVSLSYGVFCGIIYCTLVFLTGASPLLKPPLPSVTIPLVSVVLLFAFFACRACKGDYRSAILDFGSLVGGLAFVAWLFSFTIKINYFFPGDLARRGSWWVLTLIIIAGGADSFALLFGKTFGKRKFFSRISPKKTVEGFLGGTVSGIALGALCQVAFPLGIRWGQALLFASAISLISHLGDLAESILKRDAGVKDSGWLPGVGGVLDLMDSGLFAAPVTYFFMKLWFGS
jgi:phosphatidate cytidylyltransferase